MTFIVGFYTRFSIQCGENWASVPPKRECAARVPSAGDTSTNWLSKMSFWRLWQSFCSVVEKAALSSSFFLLPIHLLYVEIFVSNSHEITVDENHSKCLIFWFWTNYWIDRPFLRQMYSFKVTLYLRHFWLIFIHSVWDEFDCGGDRIIDYLAILSNSLHWFTSLHFGCSRVEGKAT